MKAHKVILDLTTCRLDDYDPCLRRFLQVEAHKVILSAVNSTRRTELREVGQQVSDDLIGLLTKAAAK